MTLIKFLKSSRILFSTLPNHLYLLMKKLLLLCLLLISLTTFSQVDPGYFSDMKWRMIGPHRAGRTIGAVGVPQQPNVFYMAANNGGVWKTTDAGKTWKNMGLKDGQQIGGLSIDPKDENKVFVAVLGHPYGANTERGVYRTKDGGVTWEKVLYKDENTGAVQVTIDPNNPNVVYADLWAARQGPWENGAWQGPESGLYKSSDGGSTWRKLTQGLPTVDQGLGRIGFCIAPSNSNRLYATVDA